MIAASGARFPFLKEVVELGGFQVKTVYKSKKRILQLLRRRFKLFKSQQKLRRYALAMIEDAYENFWTRTYAKCAAPTRATRAPPAARTRAPRSRLRLTAATLPLVRGVSRFQLLTNGIPP